MLSAIICVAVTIEVICVVRKEEKKSETQLFATAGIVTLAICEFILCSIQIMVLVLGYNLGANFKEMSKAEPTIEEGNP